MRPAVRIRSERAGRKNELLTFLGVLERLLTEGDGSVQRLARHYCGSLQGMSAALVGPGDLEAKLGPRTAREWTQLAAERAATPDGDSSS